MGIFTENQRKLVPVYYMEDSVPKKIVVIRSQVEYVDWLIMGLDWERIKRVVGMNSSDLDNWNKEKGFKEYVRYRLDTAGWSGLVTKEFVMSQFAKAAVGEIELTKGQFDALKEMAKMASEATLSNNKSDGETVRVDLV